MPRRVFSAGLIAIVLGLLVAAPRAHAAPDAGVFVSNLGDAGIQAVNSNIPAEQRAAQFRQLFMSDFDVAGIGRFAIGHYWNAYTPEQQQEFLRLYADFTAKAYADKLGQYRGARLQVTGIQPGGEETIVTSQVMRTGGQPIQMDWHLIQSGDGYKVTDVYVDRVSMKATQREDFAKIIQNNGGQPSALLAVLRQELRQSSSRTGQ